MSNAAELARFASDGHSGAVLKVSATSSTANTTFSNNSGETLIITVSHVAEQANSDFLISASVLFGSTASGEEAAHMVLKDNTTKILSGADDGNRPGVFGASDSGSNANRVQMMNNTGLYTASTHSAGDTKTFNLFFFAPNSSANYVLNKSSGDTDTNFYPRGASHLTVTEIAT